MKARYVNVRETASTNTYMASVKNVLPDGTVVYTFNQTSGRGQRGNSWESEPGKNITFSLLMKGLAVLPREQFYISEAVSLAIVEVLNSIMPGFKIKWPNDIYFGDMKVCGMLIENTLMGECISHSIVGVGVNVNQEKFLSDAPNPQSLTNITGNTFDCEELLHRICDAIYTRVQILYGTVDANAIKVLHEEYLAHLYRNDGKMYRFSLPSGDVFRARIAAVDPDGRLSLIDSEGNTTSYYFKEISFLL